MSSLLVQRVPVEQQITAALDKADPVAGVGDFPAAFRILNGLAMNDMLNTLFRLIPLAEIPSLADTALGAEYAKGLDGDPERLTAVEEELDKRSSAPGGWGMTAFGQPPAVGTAGETAITPEVAIKILENYSKGEAPFKFLVVADPKKIKLKGGPQPLIAQLEVQGLKAEPVLVEAAEAMANSLKWAGRVRTVLRVGGRIMIVVAIAADLIKIYYAKDHTKAVFESVGGWAGASAGAAAFTALWAPADVVGPWAWAGHGVGVLVAGGIGYWIGSKTVRTVYELVVEN